MLDLATTPLPEQEQNQLLNAVRDIMHNGGRIPQDVSNELIMAAILELNGCVRRTANQSRRNASMLKLLGLGLFLLAAIMAVTIGDQFGLVGALTTIIGL